VDEIGAIWGNRSMKRERPSVKILSVGLISTERVVPNFIRLDELESIIERGMQTFVEVGMALLEIRDKKLYKKDHQTFEDYCHKRWGWERRHGYELIAAAQVASNVRLNAQSTPESASTVPTLTQAVQLASLPAERQREVVQAIEENGDGLVNTTVREIKEVVRDVKRGTAPKQAAAKAKARASVPKQGKKKTDVPADESPRGRVTALDELGDLNAKPGSRPWTLAVRDNLTRLLRDVEFSSERARSWFQQLRDTEGWRQLSDTRGQTFKSFDAFCYCQKPSGLGYEISHVERIIQDRTGEHTKTAHAKAKAKGNKQETETEVSRIYQSFEEVHPSVQLEFIKAFRDKDGAVQVEIKTLNK
jgi:hypothetical protein